MVSITDMATFCKRKGFVYRTSEIYNGISGFFDYGPLGVEVKNAIKQAFWKRFVHDRADVVGMDGSIISHPSVWKASGHTDNFSDVMVECEKCKEKTRADTLLEEKTGASAEGLTKEAIKKGLQDNNIACPKCGGPLGDASDFNLMFHTEVGPTSGNISYLRPETAQLIFSNFKQIIETSRMKLPFGIAQTGKAFRNEISPRDFLFRCREFEQFEIEFFCHPEKLNDCPYFEEIENLKVQVLTAAHQKKNEEHTSMTFGEMVNKKLFKTQWHAFWVGSFYQFFIDYGVQPEHLRLREHVKDELAHYASACFDIEYNFPFGWKEIHGNADRGTFDLDQHTKQAKQDFSVFDEETKQKVVPYVAAEPSQGIDRAFLVFLYDAYSEDKERGNLVLKLHPKLAAYKVAVFPLVNKLEEKAKDVFSALSKMFPALYDRAGSVGRRYARADEIGIPYCVTIDFDTLEDDSVTVRDRDSTEQERVKVEELPMYLHKKVL